MTYGLNSTIGEIASTERGIAVLKKHIRYDEMMQNYPQNCAKTLSSATPEEPSGLNMLAAGFGLTTETAQAILNDLKKPVEEILPEVKERKSLDELDRESFQAGPAPFDTTPQWIQLTESGQKADFAPEILCLDGQWEMISDGSEADRLNKAWENPIPAHVPGSVHAALVAAGIIPDPTFGENQKIAREESYKTWWFKKTFACTNRKKQMRLSFDGICNQCQIWLNGTLLGAHEGMFGGPEFDVSHLIQEQNTLIVKLEPIPFVEMPPIALFSKPSHEINQSWANTVVFNNVYGWHYSNLPALGIWRSVNLVSVPDVEMPNPFIATMDEKKGEMRLQVTLNAQTATKATLRGVIQPDNFDGKQYSFTVSVDLMKGKNVFCYAFQIPDPQLWWPIDLGKQNLYRMQLSVLPSDGSGDVQEILFGIRTVRMAPLPEGPSSQKYNWTFVVNGEPHFIKGTGWCTLDPLMDFSRERYNRFLALARDQHIQLMRAWGSGMPETDDFYELCSRYGIMVLQEWPTAWNSHLSQPYEILKETVYLNTLRIRNSPALVMWGCGNESSNPFGEAIDMMGKSSIELDGTRPFHRGEGWGGSAHDYTSYWGRKSLQYYMTMEYDVLGEFGLACSPNYESIQRYLPQDEWSSPPPNAGPCYTYHTPIFGMGDDLSRLAQYAGYFLPEEYDMRQFVRASQMSQALGVRHPLERARVRWPESSAAIYYKMNDNFPACSWACVDWYGAPKLSHYLFQDAFAPLHACVITDQLNTRGTPAEYTVYLLDDANALKDSSWEVRVAAYGKELKKIKEECFTGQGSVDAPLRLGAMTLSYIETDTCPLFVTAEVLKDGLLVDRTFYWYNFENEKGCLFRLPKTTLDFSVDGNVVTVRNTGKLPAVAVEVAIPGQSHTFTCSDNDFWLNPGESLSITVNATDDLQVSAWNA